MKSAENNVSGGAPDLATVTPLITAIGTAIAAWKLFEPKFARIRALREENGRLEPGFIIFYEAPQRFLVLSSSVIALTLLIAFVNSVWPVAFARYIPLAFIKEITNPSNIILTIFLIRRSRSGYLLEHRYETAALAVSIARTPSCTTPKK